MSPGNERAPATWTGTLYESATTPNSTPQSSRHQGRTQYDRVLAALMANDEVCGHRTFYGEMMIPRFSSHLHRARRNGMVISKRPCDWHDHEGTAYLYRLEALPSLPGIGNA